MFALAETIITTRHARSLCPLESMEKGYCRPLTRVNDNGNPSAFG